MTEVAARLMAALADRYRIERELGQGGMATVYLAEDLKHGRKVAIKVLRPELAAVIGAERFVREIRTIAALQHPHILGLIDSGEVQGTAYYVMPFVEGESLRDRLTREKQLSIDDCVRFATEVASALDYAHRHNVIHRDIKPENILLHDGQALVADFGIALAASSAGGSRMTETGMSLGTPHYMSPEQAMGEREITARSDIYALGCVTYEMLVGEPPFTGPTAQAIVARMMTEEPRSLIAQRRTVPPHVETAVLAALQKLPADRFATAGGFLQALEATGRTALATAGRTISTARGPGIVGRPMLLVPFVIVTLGAALWAGAVWGRRYPLPSPVARYSIDIEYPGNGVPNFDLSPDGSVFVYISGAEGGQRLFVKSRDASVGRAIPGVGNAWDPAVSADGRWVAFRQVPSNQLMKVPISGGSPILLGDSVSGYGSAWLSDGSVVYARGTPETLVRVAADGRSSVLFRAGTDSIVTVPSPLPDARGALFVLCDGDPVSSSCPKLQELWVADLAHGGARRLLPGIVKGWYVDGGFLVCVRATGGVVAVPFDARRMVVTGEAEPILDKVAQDAGLTPYMAVARSGVAVMLVVPPSAPEGNAMVWVDRSGQIAAGDSVSLEGSIDFIDLSPDGQRAAVDLRSGTSSDIWLHDWRHGVSSRLTFGGHADSRPRWTPDGRSITFLRDYGEVVTRRADNTGTESVVKVHMPVGEADWSPDGRWLLMRTGIVDHARDIVAMRPGSDSTPQPLLADPDYDEKAMAISPDGRWLAYESNESGRDEIYVRPFTSVNGGKWQVSPSGGLAPRWSHSGGELFYVHDSNMRVATIATGPVFRVLGERVLFPLPSGVVVAENHAPYGVYLDGRRFLMIRGQTRVGPLHLTVIENWLTEIRTRMAGHN